MTRLLATLAALAVLLGSVSADAQRRRRLTPDERRARELFQLGDESYANGRYDAAIAAFEEAYRLSERPLLLFNLANAQERAGYLRDAIASLESYLPHARRSERAEVESRLAALRERVAEEERAAEEARRAEEARAAAEAAAEAERSQIPAEPLPAPSGPDLTLPALVLGGAGALLVGAGVTGGLALAARDEASASCVDGLCSVDAAGPLRTDEALSITTDVLALTGLAAAGVGVWLLVDALSAEDEAPVSAAVTPSGAALFARGRF